MGEVMSDIAERYDKLTKTKKMSKTIVHTPEDFSSYTKEMKETIIKSIKEEYGDKVTILSYIPKSIREYKPKQRR